MLKIAAIVSLMLIVATWSQADSRRHKKEATESRDFETGSTLWAASLSCDSCGSECTSACGTRHFRSCCFNYLRKKRGSDALRFLSANHEKFDFAKPSNMFMVENIPDQYMNYVPAEYKPYYFDDAFENRLQGYEA